MSSHTRRTNPVISNKSKLIPVNTIRINREYEVNPKTFEIAKYLEIGGAVEPILVVKGSKGYTVRDGHHRYTAHRLVGLRDILVVFK